MKNLFLLLAITLGFNALAQKGTISGTVSDKSLNNEPLPFANVVIKDTTVGVNTDETGKYSLKVEAGTYIIQFSFVGYETVEQSVTVPAGETVTVDVALGAGSYTLKDVELQATGSREKETALLVEQKKAVEIKQSIGAQEMSRKGVSTVEEGLTKISGITKVGSRGLFVRGLEDRYNNLLINDMAVPSNSPFKKIVPLDLFPTDIVGVIDVYKTFNPNIYGDFAGGTFNIATSRGGKSVTKFSVGVGYTTDNNLSDFSLSEDADTGKGFFGMTGKDRALPAIFGGIPSNPTLSGQQSLNAFKSGFNVNEMESPLNMSVGLLHTEKFNLKNDSKFTYLLSLNFDNSYKVTEGVDRSLQGGANTPITFDNDFSTTENMYETNISSLIGLNYKTDRLDLAMNAFYLRNTVNTIEDQFGIADNIEANPNVLIRTNQLDQSDYLIGQLTGKYFINSAKTQSVRGGFTYSKTSFQQPDRKFFSGTKTAEDEIVTSYGGNNFLRQYLDVDGTFYFSGLGEYALNFGKEKKNQLTVGYNGNSTETISSYRFVSTDSSPNFTTSINDIDTQINADLMAGNVFHFRESSNAQYKVKLLEIVYAGYANLLWHLSDKWEINGGIRTEQASRETKYRQNGSFTQPYIKKTFEKLYILPSVNVKYGLSERTNLRFAAGVTYTKPVLIEALPISYINADGTSINGNPYLKNSDNYNVDFKYEIFPTSKEMFAVGVFGKKINNAIERSFQATAGGFQTTYFNTGNATLFGAELEFIVDLGRLSDDLKDFSFGFNTSLMQTNIKVNPKVINSVGQIVDATDTHDDRDLQGASKWLINSDLKYQFNLAKEWSNTVSLVYSVFGKRIFSTGSIPFDHIYELPVSKLDLVWGSKVSQHFDVKFSVDNILNPKVKYELGEDNATEYTENSRVLRDYKRGVSLSLGLTYTL